MILKKGERRKAGERGERERRQRRLNLEVCVSSCSPETPAPLLLLLLYVIKPLAASFCGVRGNDTNSTSVNVSCIFVLSLPNI